MRSFRNLLALSGAVTLAACGGDTRPQTVGNAAPPAGTSTAISGGAGGGVSSTPTPTPTSGTAGTFLGVSAATSFDVVGGFHSLKQDTTTLASLYQGDATTTRGTGGTVSYDPRDGIFTLTLADNKAGVNRNYRFQDPAHRTTPSVEVPNFGGFNYLDVLDDSTTTPMTVATFFYQRPDPAKTTYVSLAGFVRNSTANNTYSAERGAFVFGQATPTAQVPITGLGTYKGGFIATMVNSQNGGNGSSLQWLSGDSKVDIDFASGATGLQFTGTAGDGSILGVATTALGIPSGTPFFANGRAVIDLIRTGGFTGAFQSVCFFAACGTAGSVAVDFSGISPGSSVAGASSIDGMFYGPNGVNLGGSFRVIGGVPNQRVDILGAFTGAKQ